MINNRQAGRRRGRGGGGNGQRPGGNPGRPDNGNRIDNRARGNANQLYEKYKNLARDAQMQGDRVNTEYYLQFADHYFRVLSESRSRFEEQGQRRPRDENYVNGFDDFDGDEDLGDEGEPIRAGEQSGEQPEPRREGQRRDGQPDRGGQERGGQERGRDRRDRRDDERRPAYGQGGHANGQVNGHGEAGDVNASVEARGPAAPEGEAGELPVAARRRGRPRRERAVSGDEAPAGLDADRLPPALSTGGDTADAGEDAPKPRRRRARPAQEEAPAA